MHLILKFFRKNQRNFLAILCVVSMVTFVINLAPGGLGGWTKTLGAQAAGTIEGVKFTQDQMTAAMQEWALLRQLGYQDPQHPTDHRPLVAALLDEISGSIAEQEINKNPRTFFLMLQEARQRGIVVSNEELQSVLVNNIAPETIPTDQQDNVEPAVSDLLVARAWLQRQLQVIKVTQPYRYMKLATEGQAIVLNVESFPASQYLDKVPDPTPDAIQTQYDAYKDTEPGDFSAVDDTIENPSANLGFGYRMPERRKVQFIGLESDDVRRAAIATKSALDWNIQAVDEFRTNRDDYDSREVPVPATQPSAELDQTMPSTEPTTQMSVKKLDDFDQDFLLHKELVLEDLYRRAGSELSDKICRKITDAMNQGYGDWHDAENSNPTTLPAAAAEFASMDFVTSLSKSIQDQFGILPITGDIDQFKTNAELAALDNIGKTYVIGQNGQEYPFALYAPTLSIWQPSQQVQDFTGNVFIFRVSGIDPSHVQPLSDVKDQVAADCKRAAAYQLALAAAKSFLVDAKSAGLAAAAKADGLVSPTKTDEFLPYQILNSQQGATIAPLILKPVSVRELAQGAEKLIMTPATTEPSTAPSATTRRPTDLIQLYPDADAMVAELSMAMQMWGNYGVPDENTVMLRQLFAQREQLIQALCDYDTLSQRVNFVLFETKPATAPAP
ncbi:MAG: hypothetical protein ABSG31_14420 [Tepidisphaeraceae bacterium]|jgi:hypothetical protein